MKRWISLALQLVIILILLKICFGLVIMVIVAFVKAIPALALTVLALVLLDKLFDEDEKDE